VVETRRHRTGGTNDEIESFSGVDLGPNDEF
jgi:hypothetical protein